MLKLTKRKGFNFFRSYYDVYNELETDKDKVAFIEALLDRQFLGIKPTNLTGMAKFAYISQTNSIDSQVKGYEDKTKTILHPTQGGSVGGTDTPCLQVEVKEKEKVKEEKIFTKSQLIDELLSDNDTPDENVDSIVALLNDVDVDKIGEPKIFKITKKIFDKFNLKGLDNEYKTKLIDYLRKDDKVI